MDANMVLRLGAAGLLGLMLFGAAFALRQARKANMWPFSVANEVAWF